MSVSLHRIVAPLAALALLAALGVGAPARAQNGLSAEGNAALLNPYPEPDFDQFGRAMASGDFDGNGIADLAVAEANSGRMRVYRGVAWTVGAVGPVIKFLATTVDTPFFNGVIASGDVDGDGRDEVVLGAVASSTGGVSDAGAVYVYDRAAGGAWSQQEEIRLGQFGYGSAPQQGDQLGRALALGNFNGDAYVDLAIGLPLRDVAGVTNAGAVLVTYGSPSGITAAGHRFFDRSDPVPGDPGMQDFFGLSLASADFDDDGYDDLAVGARGAHCDPSGIGNRGGGVAVLRGAPAGLSAAFSQWFGPGYDGVPGDCRGAGPAALSFFGATLTAGRLSFDLDDDLLIGAPDSSGGGAVVALYGQAGGLAGSSAQVIRGSDMPSPVSASADFGSAVAIASLRSGAFQAASVAIGAPRDSFDGSNLAGSVWVVHATANRPDPATAQRWTASSGLAVGPADPSDTFGSALAVGDFNDDGRTDLAVAVPLHDGAGQQAGAVQVLYQSGFIFRNGFQ